MKKIYFLLILTFLSIEKVHTQFISNPEDYLINAYDSKISGTDYYYHSFIPDLHESILIRADNGKDFMEWETEAIQKVLDDKKYISFIWIAAIGSGPGKADFKLETNKGDSFIFYSDGIPEWEQILNNGTKLSFTKMWTDQYGDHHGYMQLKFLKEKLEIGKKLRIKVSGGKTGLTSWYMTYKKAIKTKLNIKALPAIIKDKSHLKQLAVASIFYFGKGTEARFYIDDKIIATENLQFGYNYIRLKLDPVSKTKKLNVKTEIDGQTEKSVLMLEPVKKWEISFVQHSHTDIGYTRSQTEILAEHLRYIDYALDFCDATDNFPENAKFKWVCEASWAVDEYIKARPISQIERLKKRVKEGRIEVTAMYFNFSELADEQQLAFSLDALNRIKKTGIDVKLAMQNDVNGIGWSLNDYFNTLDVKYLNMGTHGHRALICFDKPTLFWWESPSGKRMLTFRAEHYMTGNTVFELQSGDLNKFTDKMLTYLMDLNKKNYPYNEIAIQHSGYLTDNSPPSTSISELIKQWNEIFEFPKLTTSTATAFFEKMESKYTKDIPVIKGYWPDWWADGLGASAREVAACRSASANFNAYVSGLSMAKMANISVPENTKQNISLAQESMLFYTEHTTGYSESVREPLSLNTMEQRALKDSYAWEAHRRISGIGENTMGLLQSIFNKEKLPSLLIFNTLNWKRNGLLTVYIDHQLIGVGKKAVITDKEGNLIPTQAISSRSDGTYWAVYLKDIPAFGFKKFNLKAIDEPLSRSLKPINMIFENQWYKIEIDSSKGVINSLYDKELNSELVDSTTKLKIGEFILEQLENRGQLESFRLDSYKRKSLDHIKFDGITNGDIWTSYKFLGESETVENPRGFAVEFMVFNTEKRIDINFSIIKKNITTPESIYIAFPFALKEGKHFTEVAGGIVENGKDQIKGSSADWAVVQGFTSVRNSQSQIVLNCNEMPLMQFGNINTGRFKAGAMPETTHIFSWPMNNYWTTNFNADQRGGHSWTYNITSTKDVSNSFATQFGWNCRIPFLSRVMQGGGEGDSKWEGSFLEGLPENVILINTVPINDDYIKIQLREIDGKNTILELKDNFNHKNIDLIEADAIGNSVKNGISSIKAYESKFFVFKTR